MLNDPTLSAISIEMIFLSQGKRLQMDDDIRKFWPKNEMSQNI